MPLPINDNGPDDKYLYEVHVFTGTKKHAETDSKVYMEMVGADEDTGTLCLEDGVRKVRISLHFT